MRLTRCAWVALALPLLVSAALQAQQPQMPTPVKEHAWLQQLAGTWDSDVDVFMEPGKPPLKFKGSESARMLGGFWIIAEGKGDMMGTPFTSIFTIGYDAEKKQYIASWVDSTSNLMWKYAGTVNSTGKALTLETEGPCPMRPGKVTKFKEVIEFQDKDRRTLTSTVLGEDGKWVTMVVARYQRRQ